ncbi:hypothetical protein I7I53_09972 [Histoplasma capsulatum var. duboisii H88]|uniref:DUF7704 domain-containing protein n=1 Tax=Ajellomyces capsulatus (strain H88) TaxID=544711 RepID=A0A8A1L6K3_AJEC8|nr:hypothetical protein I7I53_09972 [Histoplasma capsulatum var. duboisii H88]
MVPPNVVKFALKKLAAAFVFLSLTEALALNSTRDLKVFREVVLFLFACDLVYMSSIQGMGGTAGYWMQPWLWGVVGWGNFGTTWIGIIVRGIFLYDVVF